MSEPESTPLKTLIDQDIVQYITFSSDFSGGTINRLKKISAFFTPSLLCCFLYRLAHYCYIKGFQLPARVLTRINFIIHKADISPGCSIGGGLYIPHTVGIAFYGHAGNNLTLYARAIVGPMSIIPDRTVVCEDAPVMGDNVFIGAHAIVKGQLSIGNDSIVGPKCVLQQSIADKTTVFSSERILIRDKGPDF